LESLCTCVRLSGIPRKGRAAVHVSITSPATGETEKFTVAGGDLWVYPLSIGVPARVRLSVAGRGASINGRRQLKLDLDGGTAGLIIDARGRPLPLATTLKARAAQIPQWYAQATGDDVFEIPAEWLQPPVVEPDIPSVVDRRKAQKDRVLTVLENAEAPSQPQPRGRMFGRRVQTNTQRVMEAEPEEDEDDLRNLLS
jgi:hypothetical protein